MCVVIFFYNFCLKRLSFYDKFSEILSQMYVYIHIKYRYACQMLKKLDFFRQVFNSRQTLNFNRIRSVGAELFHTDRHDEANSRYLEFRERA